MEPARSIITKLGGEGAVALICGIAVSGPYRWQYPRERGGTGGLIPQRHHRALIDHAEANGIPLTAEEFLPPRVGEPASRHEAAA
jgi:hypothetical protein